MARELTHVISFRTTAYENRELRRLKGTFGEEGGWRETFGWLLGDPAVQELIEDRLNEMSPAKADGSWGIERSVPRGDR